MTRLRFPRSVRLSRSSEFARVSTQGRAEHGKLMICKVARLSAEEIASTARVGIVTSRRVGSAVVRNRVRRRLRELVRVDLAALPANCWVVLIAKAAAANASFDDLRAEWRRLANRAGLLVLD
jgi:ribonuclease P protein component